MTTHSPKNLLSNASWQWPSTFGLVLHPSRHYAKFLEAICKSGLVGNFGNLVGLLYHLWQHCVTKVQKQHVLWAVYFLKIHCMDLRTLFAEILAVRIGGNRAEEKKSKGRDRAKERSRTAQRQRAEESTLRRTSCEPLFPDKTALPIRCCDASVL